MVRPKVRLQALAFTLLILLLSLPITNASANPSEKPDTKVKGVVRYIQHDYNMPTQNGKIYHFTAWIMVQITKIIENGSSFPYGRDFNQLGPTVDVGYNASQWPDVTVDDLVEVYGLWVPIPFYPTPVNVTLSAGEGSMISINDSVQDSYIRVIGVYDNYGLTQPYPTVSLIDTGKEYVNGSISQGGVNMWYTWINSSNTQVAFFTYYSKVYNSPIMTFLGQHYMTADGQDVFMGNTLLLMEMYNDTNGNGIPDMNLITGASEVEYFLLANSSQSFIPIPVKKTSVNGISHYTWGIRHKGIDGALLYPESRIIDGILTNIAVSAHLDHLTLTYDYYIEGNVSYLKTGIDTGPIPDVIPYLSSNISFRGLSLSVLYGTAMISSKPYAVLVNNQPYNSTEATESSTLTNSAEVVISNKKAYEFLFNKSYTLYNDSMTQSFASKTVASATVSIASNAYNYISPEWIQGWLENYLPDAFPQIKSMPGNLSLSYETSSFVYRVCYPLWDGKRVEHDPTYVSYISSTPANYGPGGSQVPSFPFEYLAMALVGLVALFVSLIEFRRLKLAIKVNPLVLLH